MSKVLKSTQKTVKLFNITNIYKHNQTNMHLKQNLAKFPHSIGVKFSAKAFAKRSPLHNEASDSAAFWRTWQLQKKSDVSSVLWRKFGGDKRDHLSLQYISIYGM